MKATGNPKKGEPEKLQSSPVNEDSFLAYNRPLMKFYRSSSAKFNTNTPKCQKAFKSLFPKALPSSVHIPMKQLTSMETVARENTRVM